MGVGRKKTLLWCAAIALLATGAAAFVAAALWPLAGTSGGASDVPVAALAGIAEDAAPLASFEPAWKLDLRRPLKDSAVPTTGQSDAIGETLPVRLVGTILDPAHPRGIFITVLGQMELKGVGEKTGGAEIVRIEEKAATLSIAGRAVTIKLEKTEIPATPAIVPPQPPSARSDVPPTGEIIR